jgi:adenylate cyclase
MRVGLEFEDSEIEADYVRDARAIRSKSIRVLLGIALVGIVGFAFVAPELVRGAQVTSLTRLLFLQVIVLGATLFFSSTRYYLENTWGDFANCLPIGMTQLAIGYNFALLSTSPGWPPIASFTGNAIVFVVFTTISFAAASRWYVLLLLLLFSAYVWIGKSLSADLGGLSIGALLLAGVMAASLTSNILIEGLARRLFLSQRNTRIEKQRSEALLYNVLPEGIADRLKLGHDIADSFADVTVIFVDLVGSSALARNLSPQHFVEILNKIFSLGDRCAGLSGVEKVKTIGDAYLAVAGVSRPNGAQHALDFARQMIEGLRGIASATGLDLKFRIGIHSGPVIGGVIGETKPSYDYWGDTMNVASRVQSVAIVDGISVSEQTYFRTKDLVAFAEPRTVTLKGIGARPVYDVVLTGLA